VVPEHRQQSAVSSMGGGDREGHVTLWLDHENHENLLGPVGVNSCQVHDAVWIGRANG